MRSPREKDGEIGKKPWSNPPGTLKTVSPRGPGTPPPWVFQARGPLSPEQRPASDKFTISLPFRGLQGSRIEAGGKEGRRSQRGLEKNVLEGAGSLLNGLSLPRKARAEKWPGVWQQQRWLMRALLVGWARHGQMVAEEGSRGSWWGNEEVIDAPK